jgi:hypothetical protein
MRAAIPFTLLACVLIASLLSAPAQAHRAHTFVTSRVPADNSVCSYSQPCRTFQGAYAATAVGGEITALDTAGYGNLSISHSITITVPAAIEAGMAPASGQDAIDIAAGLSDVVALRGLTLEGGGGLNGREGISLTAGGTLVILDCVIKDFQDGVLVEPTSGTTQVMIKNTTVLNSSNAGIYITPHGSANAVATLNQVTTDLNNYGMYFDQTPTSGAITATIDNSHATNNVNAGIVLNAVANTNASATIFAEITGSTINRNCSAGCIDLEVNGKMYAALSRNKVGYLSGTTSSVYSDGTNFINFSTPTITNVGTR